MQSVIKVTVVPTHNIQKDHVHHFTTFYDTNIKMAKKTKKKDWLKIYCENWLKIYCEMKQKQVISKQKQENSRPKPKQNWHWERKLKLTLQWVQSLNTC